MPISHQSPSSALRAHWSMIFTSMFGCKGCKPLEQRYCVLQSLPVIAIDPLFFLSMKATPSLFSISPPTVSLQFRQPTSFAFLFFIFYFLFFIFYFLFFISFHSAPPYRSILTVDKNRVSGSLRQVLAKCGGRGTTVVGLSPAGEGGGLRWGGGIGDWVLGLDGARG